MKLPNGYGSIFKLGGKRRRPYAVLITAGWTDEGKAIRKYHSYHRTRAEAMKALSDYNANPYSVERADITLADLWEKWRGYRKERGKTVQRYHDAAFAHAKPLHKKPFRDIQTSQIQGIVDSLTSKPATAQNVKGLFHLLYKYARLLDICKDNRADLVELPAMQDSKKHKPFSREEVESLWQHDEWIAQIALVLCYTGMRPGELLAIRRENVHLEDRYLIGGMKTKAGINRTIPIAERILPIVESFMDESTEYLVELKGKPVTYSRMAGIWKRSGIPALENHLPHDGRHTCETALDNASTNKRIIQLIIGHAGRDVDDAVYTHKTVPQLIAAINKLEFV